MEGYSLAGESADQHQLCHTAVTVSTRRVLRSLVCCALLMAAGCGTTRFLSVRRVVPDPVLSELPITLFVGRQPSDRAANFLERTGGSHLDNPHRIVQHCRLHQRGENPDRDAFHTAAELLYLMADRTRDKDPDLAAELYYDSAEAAWGYFACNPSGAEAADPSAEEHRDTATIYNSATQNLLQLVTQQNEFAAGGTRRLPVTGRRVRFEVATPTRMVPADFCGKFEFVDAFRLRNIRKRHAARGLGSPLIMDLTAAHRNGRLADYYTERMTAASTVLLDFSRQQAGGNAADEAAVFRLFDTRETTSAMVDGRFIALESDLTTPLARQLSNPRLSLLDTTGLLRPDLTESLEGLYMVEPFDPERIPVVLVHGFWANPMVWMQILNDLHARPEVRQRYQFWFYLYPTGEPLPIVAARMRKTLKQMRVDCDPEQSLPNLDEMVVVGHSMGGILAHMLTIDSGDQLWNSVSRRPIDSLPFSGVLKEQLRATYFFEREKSVRHIITLAAPYGGTSHSNQLTRGFLRGATWLPTRTVRLTKAAMQLDDRADGFVQNLARTSIDSLARDSAVLDLVRNKPAGRGVTHSNIVAYRKRAPFLSQVVPAGDLTDGVVRVRDAAAPVWCEGIPITPRLSNGVKPAGLFTDEEVKNNTSSAAAIVAGHSEILRLEKTSQTLGTILMDSWQKSPAAQREVQTAAGRVQHAVNQQFFEID